MFNKSGGFRPQHHIIYITILTIIGLAVRHFYSISIPDNVSIGIGVILCIAGVVVLLLESRDTKGSYFYSYADNWNGWGLINSGLIFGISVFFIGVTVKMTILYFLLLCILNLVVRILAYRAAVR
jgi:hypothetical protein